VSRPTSRGAVKNRLLDALPRKDRDRLLERCEQVEIKLGDVLYEPKRAIRYVFFPTSSFISLITPINGDASLEVGLVGSEGMLGISLILGVDAAPQRALVQGPGSALRIKAAPFCRELERSPLLRRELNRYLYVTLWQVALTAVCTRFHVVEARLARWLLMTSDRAHSDHFYITQEFMSYMLGVRRVGVTQAAGVLRGRKLIRYNRGQINILDRRGLRAAACSCYGEALEVYNRILG
jgi:CRP-like cAMP-binding protein